MIFVQVFGNNYRLECESFLTLCTRWEIQLILNYITSTLQGCI